ncbi:hypothetical protein QBC46DRAFT_382441 [Diplogelasinospora grovesii]|uniref:Uncharacterized protein n=1 Tax=Diplogelasinospora grovesii TaxID=303347 RepID=A0AAN6S680_9PEZI|nr:hypothetical protein QBC46DRAFT_382441 [Diplogelasinospora grovesii]
MNSPHIDSPDVRGIVIPLLSSLPGAAISTQPPTTILPLLSPILRQRVQLLSSGSTEPWIRLLTYDTAKVPKLKTIAQSGELEPHPASGEIEIDWDYDVQIKYRRVDKETLQTLVVLGQFDIFLRLVYCVGDKDGGGDGWRVGEVGVASDPSPLDSFGGFSSIQEAEASFETANSTANKQINGIYSNGISNGAASAQPVDDGEDDDDDDYWARYDATPARTPATKRSPAPQSIAQPSQASPYRSSSAEDAYFAQYDSVQPAMDPHDPDEEVEGMHAPPSGPSGLNRDAAHSVEQTELNETSGAWTLAEPPRSPSERSTRSRQDDEERAAGLVHPRPESSASSNGSLTVAKLEESAEKREQSEFGVKQHISRSIRSLFLLSRASGIDREEFERMVRTELDVLGMVEDDI